MKLTPITEDNINECISLKRESTKYVGDGKYVLEHAKQFNNHFNPYGIYHNDLMVGVVLITDVPYKGKYKFTDLFIADDFQGKGLGKMAVKIILDKFVSERKSNIVEIQVHESNEAAIKSYVSNGFKEISRAEWDKTFIVMSLNI